MIRRRLDQHAELRVRRWKCCLGELLRPLPRRLRIADAGPGQCERSFERLIDVELGCINDNRVDSWNKRRYRSLAVTRVAFS